MQEHTLSLRERKKLRNRNHILDAARDLFQAQGFEATSVEQISAAAEVSRGTFFNYFSTKESLLSEIADEELRSLEHRVATDLASMPSAVARIRHTMHLLVGDTLQFLQLTRYIFVEALRHPAGASATSVKLGGILTGLVRQAQAQGEIRADLDPAQIARAISGAYLAALFHWIAAGDPSPAPGPVVDILDMLLEGIAGPQYRARDASSGGRPQGFAPTYGKNTE